MPGPTFIPVAGHNLLVFRQRHRISAQRPPGASLSLMAVYAAFVTDTVGIRQRLALLALRSSSEISLAAPPHAAIQHAAASGVAS